jgi:hypothetical protein
MKENSNETLFKVMQMLEETLRVNNVEISLGIVALQATGACLCFKNGMDPETYQKGLSRDVAVYWEIWERLQHMATSCPSCKAGDPP